MATITRLPKCIYARGYGASQTFHVSVTTDGVRQNLGTFKTIEEASAKLLAYRLSELSKTGLIKANEFGRIK